MRQRTLCGHVNFVVGSGNPTNVRGKRVYVRQGSIEKTPSSVIFASSQGMGDVEVHSCKAWSSNSRSLCFGCGVSKEGQQLVREHVNAPPNAGSNTTRQQPLSTPSMPVQTETEEHVRGKKALKKHPQRSIDKLVAAKEQLPEEEGREVAEGITDRIKALQLQKDGIMSVAARKKKAFAQLEESEKTLNPSAKPYSRHRRLRKKRVENMLLLKRHVHAWNTKSKRRKTKTRRCTKRTRITQGILTEIGTTRPRELKEMRTAISQISDTLALLLKTLPPVLWKLVRR